MSEERTCPLCLRENLVSTHFGHLRAGGICSECYDYLDKVFMVIHLQKIARGLEYLADKASMEEE